MTPNQPDPARDAPLLAINRASSPGSWALCADGAVCRHGPLSTQDAPGTEWARILQTALHPSTGDSPAPQGFLTGLGPGSFSGIRAAIAALQGLSLPRNLPVLGLSNAAVLAWNTARALGRDRIAVLGDARRQRLWCALYAVTPDRRLLRLRDGTPPSHDANDFMLWTWDELTYSLPGNIDVVSLDWPRLRPRWETIKLSARPVEGTPPDASDLAELYVHDPRGARHNPLPIYLHPAV